MSAASFAGRGCGRWCEQRDQVLLNNALLRSIGANYDLSPTPEGTEVLKHREALGKSSCSLLERMTEPHGTGGVDQTKRVKKSKRDGFTL